MRRTSYSNIFNEGYDYTCGIFNSKGQIVVQDEHVPILIASMELTLERLLEKFAIEVGSPGGVVSGASAAPLHAKVAAFKAVSLSVTVAFPEVSAVTVMLNAVPAS